MSNEFREPTFRTMRRTVLCPYCKTGFTFKKIEKLAEWKANGATEPLHRECQQAAKEAK